MKIIDSTPFKVVAIVTAIAAAGIVTVAVHTLTAPSAPEPTVDSVDRQPDPPPPPLEHPVERPQAPTPA